MLSTTKSFLLALFGLLLCFPVFADRHVAELTAGSAEEVKAIIPASDLKTVYTDAKDFAATDLMLAASSNRHPGVISELVKAGAPVNATNKRGQTALDWAVTAGNEVATKELLAANADPNIPDVDGGTILIYAAMKRQLEVVKELITARADVNLKRHDGNTALTLAAFNGFPEIVSTLLAAGADPYTNNNLGQSALLMAVFANSPETVKILIAAGSDVNVISNNGDSALTAATWKGLPGIVSLLLEAQANPNIENHNGQTPLMLAAYYDQLEAAKELIAAGTDVNIKDNNGNSALTFAASKSGPELVSSLISAGADKTVVTTNGNTPLGNAEGNKRLQGTDILDKLKDDAGGICVWTDANTPLDIFVDGTFAGSLDSYFKSGSPKWGQPGTLLVKKAPGTYIVVAKFHNGVPVSQARINLENKYLLQVQSELVALAFQNRGDSSGGTGPPENAKNSFDLGGILGGLGAVANGLGSLTGNSQYNQLGEVFSDAQEMANIASGNEPDANVPLGPQANPAAQTRGGAYRGQFAPAVNFLLSKPLQGSNTQRNQLIKAAIVAAQGADKEARAGHLDRATQLANVVHQDLQNAYSLKTYGSKDEARGEIITEQQLATYANSQ